MRMQSLFLSGILLSAPAFAGVIHTNQLGYYPEGSKVFLSVGTDADSFYVRNAVDQSIVFRGVLSDAKYWDLSGESVQQGDFSALKTEGVYIAEVPGVSMSNPFRIRTDVYASAYRDVQRGFYYWRASTAIPAQFGGRFARGFGHPDSALAYHDSLYKASGAKRDVRGGWYDAGDYGKYVVNAGMSVGLMQLFQAMQPDWTGDSLMNIPESGNGRSDLMDELRYELDWLLRMQDTDGGVFFKITPKRFEAMVLPEKDNSVRIVIGKTTAPTLDFAAMLAQAYRQWMPVDAVYADSLLKAAKAAYEWALLNSNVAYKQGLGTKYPDVSTGGYGDANFKDEFLWAKTELWLSTGDAKYKPLTTELSNPTRVDWPSVAGMAVYSLALENGVTPDATLQDHARDLVTATSDNIVNQIKQNPYRLPTVGFSWGSNGGMAAQTMSLLVAYKVTQDTSYIRAAGEVAEWFFGKNPLALSYVTGVGNNYVKAPHARHMEGDTIKDPIPGYVVGGPNASIAANDPASKLLPGCLPAKCYVDIVGSYSTNEIAINWQAPLMTLLGMVESVLGAGTELQPDNSPLSVIVASKGNGVTAIQSPKAQWAIGDTIKITSTPNDDDVFLGYSGFVRGNTADTSFVLKGDLFVRAHFGSMDTNLVRNSDFADSLDSWVMRPSYETSSGEWAMTQLKWIDSGAAIASIFPGTKTADVGMFQEGFEIAKGFTYQLEFDALATQSRSICFTFYPPSSTKSLHTVCPTISGGVSTYRWSFVPTAAFEPDARMSIEIGTDTTDLWVDNVKLMRVSGERQEDILTSAIYLPAKSISFADLKGNQLYLRANGSVNVQVWDFQGRLLGSVLRNGNSTVDLSQLAPQFRGIAWVQLESQGKSQVMRWVNTQE